MESIERRYRNGDVYDWFRYDVVRIWEQPVEEVLAAGLPVLPLAPVANVEPRKVPEVLMAISERLVRETSPEQAATLWAATKVLMGLRYPKEQVEEFTREVSAMILGIRGIEESSVYQDIFAKGEAKGEARGEAGEGRRRRCGRGGEEDFASPGTQEAGAAERSSRVRDHRAWRSRPAERPARPHPGRFDLGRASSTALPTGVSRCAYAARDRPKRRCAAWLGRGGSG